MEAHKIHALRGEVGSSDFANLSLHRNVLYETLQNGIKNNFPVFEYRRTKLRLDICLFSFLSDCIAKNSSSLFTFWALGNVATIIEKKRENFMMSKFNTNRMFL